MEKTTETHCGKCGKPYGKRKRCYWCHGKQKTGEIKQCAKCGKDFYAARWQLSDTLRNQGTYCSKKCLHDSMRIFGQGYEYERQDGYIQVYYPSHPDAPKSGWMLKHRVIAEEKYGRRILKSEHVHHINHVRNDNRPENLEVIGAGDHARISNAHGKALRKDRRDELERLRLLVARYRERFGELD